MIPRSKFLYRPKKAGAFNRIKWNKFFRRYINSKKDDIPRLWEFIALKVFDLLMKEGIVVLPGIGTLEVCVEKPKREAVIYNDKPEWQYPKSNILFSPDSNLRSVFVKKYITTGDMEGLKNKEFDWLKKIEEKNVYQRSHRNTY